MAEIAGKAGVHRRTVSRKLAVLEVAGIIEKRCGAWLLVEKEVEQGLDRVAKNRRLDVRAKKMREAFEEQRRAFYARG